VKPVRRDGVQGGGTQRQRISTTGETLFGPAEATPTGREAHKGDPRKRSNDAGQGVGGGRSTNEPRENRGEGRAATSILRSTLGKAAGMPPRGKAPPRPSQAKRKAPARLDNARKLQRTLYRVAKLQPERRFTLLYDKVCRQDILQEAWRRVKSNKGAAGDPALGRTPSGCVTLPSSRTPAFSQARIRRSTRTSPTRRATNCINSSWSMVSKETTTHYPPSGLPEASDHHPPASPISRTVPGGAPARPHAWQTAVRSHFTGRQ